MEVEMDAKYVLKQLQAIDEAGDGCELLDELMMELDLGIKAEEEALSEPTTVVFTDARGDLRCVPLLSLFEHNGAKFGVIERALGAYDFGAPFMVIRVIGAGAQHYHGSL
jgi:hypothetical protein